MATKAKKRPQLNTDRYQEKQQKLNQRAGYGKLQDGKNVLRIFTFEHVVTEKDYENGLYKKNGPHAPDVGETVCEIDRPVGVHFSDDGASNCEGRGCPICKEANEYLQSSSKSDKKTGQQMRARRQFAINAVDMNAVEQGIQVFQLPSTAYNDVLGAFNSGEMTSEELFGPEGRDFVIMRNTKLSPDKMYKVIVRDAAKSETLDALIQEDVKDLYEMESLDPGHSRSSSDAGTKKRDDEDEDEDEKPKRKAKAKKPVEDDEDEEEVKPAKKQAKKPVEDDEDDEGEDDEDEKPAKKATKKPAADEDDDDEDEDEKPAKKVAKKKPVEDDDEDEDEDAEDEDPKPKAKAAPKKKPAADEDEDGEDDEEEKPARKKATGAKPKKGDKVKFDVDGGSKTGKVVGIEGAFFIIEDDAGEEWEVEQGDFTVV